MRTWFCSGLMGLALVLAAPVLAEDTEDNGAAALPVAETTDEAPEDTTQPTAEDTALPEVEEETEPTEYRYVRPRGVPVYLEPDVAAIRIGRVQPEQALELLGEEYGWVHIRTDDLQGWVESGEVVREAPPVAEARPVASIPQLRIEQVIHPWWTAAAGFIGLMLGIVLTWLFLDMRLRRRYGGMRMKL